MVSFILLSFAIVSSLSHSKDVTDFITKDGLKWKQEHYPMQLLTLAERRYRSDQSLLKFRETITGAVFSGVFGNNAVLQRKPALAALYG